jgi:hypothetical protein
MRTNRTFAANCAATLASARSSFGGACRTNKLCGSIGRGLAGGALATTYYDPLMLTLMQDRELHTNDPRCDALIASRSHADIRTSVGKEQQRL